MSSERLTLLLESFMTLSADKRVFVLDEMRKSIAQVATTAEEPKVLPSLPTHLVSEIVGLANATNKNDPIVIEIHPDTGSQSAELNPFLLGELKELVREAVELVKKYYMVFELTRDIDDEVEFEDEIKSAIKEYSKNVQPLDKITLRSAYAYYGIDGFDMLNDPIPKAFYKKAYAIAKQLKPISETLRVKYLDKVLTEIHRKEPDLSFAIQLFVWNYVHNDSLVNDFVSPLNRKRFSDPEENYEPILDYNGEPENLDILLWAARKHQREWLDIVSGKKTLPNQ